MAQVTQLVNEGVKLCIRVCLVTNSQVLASSLWPFNTEASAFATAARLMLCLVGKWRWPGRVGVVRRVVRVCCL